MTNDNDSESWGNPAVLPDAHGRAALLLIESLIHGLCENDTLGAGEAVDIAKRAANVQLEQAEEADGAGASMWASHALLSSIVASLRIDDVDGPPRLV